MTNVAVIHIAMSTIKAETSFDKKIAQNRNAPILIVCKKSEFADATHKRNLFLVRCNRKLRTPTHVGPLLISLESS